MKHSLYICGIATVTLMLSACGSGGNSSSVSSTPGGGGPGGGGGNLIAQSAMDIIVDSPAMDTVTMAATTPVYATVFIPEHAEGATYPLIIHSHGFGGSRVSEADAIASGPNPQPLTSTTSVFTRIDNQVRLLWDAGYAVISFDERGFGGTAAGSAGPDDGDPATGGTARIIDPMFEVVDAIAVMNWAVENLDITTEGGDALVGSIGGSYGGGYQLLLSALDDDPSLGALAHVDAITPTATWYDLAQSLTPNRVIKKGFISGLAAAGTADGALLDPIVNRGIAQGAALQSSRFREEIDADIIQFFFDHGLVAFEADASFNPTPVDALITQGQQDFLFNARESANNYRFLNGVAGADVRLLTHQNGHGLPAPFATVVPPLGPSACGPIDTLAATRAWFDAKLRGNTAAISNIPEVCISLDDTTGVALDNIPVGDGTFRVTIPAGTPVSVNGQQDNNVPGTVDPIFVPITAPIASTGMVLAGIPLANLTVTPMVAAVEAVAFVGIGVQSSGEAPRLIDNQINPLRSTDSDFTDFELIGVGENLAVDDVVGILLFGSFDQFENAARTNWATNAYTISGTVDLPIISAPVITATP